jgi:hypothetical protein
VVHAFRVKGGRKNPPELLGEAGTANAQATDDDAPDKFDRGEQQGKGRKGRVRDKRTQKKQRKSPEVLVETGTADAQADAQAADKDAPTGLSPTHDKSNRGKQQGKARGRKVGYESPRKKPKMTSVAKDSSDESEYDPKDASDYASDDVKSDKKGKQRNGGKKAGTHAKPKDGDKKQGNEAINDGHNPRGPETMKEYVSMLLQIYYDQFQQIQIECF